MGVLVHSASEHYAIILGSSHKDHPERLVIAYPDENCLRDLIAEPSIVGLGYASREEAVAELANGMADPKALKQERRSAPMSYKARGDGGAGSGAGLLRNQGAALHILQCALATITVLFYSKNLISTLFRTALGFPS